MSITHGGDVFRTAQARGWDWREVLDFSANINPLGPAPGVRQAVCQSMDRIRHYPDPEAGSVRAILSKQWGVPESQILMGNGATELLHFFARVVRPAGVTLVVPGFSEFHRAFPDAAMGRWDQMERWPVNGFVAVTNPNNPTGALAREGFEDWLLSTSHPVMVDESFLDFTDAPSVMRLLDRRPRLYVLRSLTKFHAIPGLRIGALAAGEEEMAALRRVREPWQVNALAEAAAMVSLEDQDYAERTRRFVKREREWLAARVADLPGVRVEPSLVNFLYAQLDYDPKPLCDFLLDHKILLRDCSHWIGFEHRAVRLAVRTREENMELLSAWREFR